MSDKIYDQREELYRIKNRKLVQASSPVYFSIEEIRHYFEGLCLVGEHRENDMLNCALSLLEDPEDGIEVFTKYRKIK